MGSSQKNNSNMQKISLLLSPLLISAVPPKPLRDRPGRIVILGEKCPSVVGTTKFNPETYLGTWFNMANAPFFWQPDADSCITAQYYLAPDNSDYDIQVVNSELSARKNSRSTSVGKASIDTSTTGSLNVAFGPLNPGDSDATTDNYIILDTDNVNYSWVWSCTDHCDSDGNCDGEEPILWILNRDRHVPQNEINDQIDSALKIVQDAGFSQNSVNIVRSRMHITDQSGETCDNYYQENSDLKP